MAKSVPIKWRKQDERKMTNYVRKFNAKITRLEKKYPELMGTGVLPERLSTQDLRYQITTRSDFNRQMRRIDRFFKPKSTDIITDKAGNKLTRWQQREIQYTQNLINRRRKQIVEQYGIHSNTAQSLNLTPIDYNKELDKLTNKQQKAESLEEMSNNAQEWYNFLYTMEREAQQNYYDSVFYKAYNAYLKVIQSHMGEYADEIIAFIKDNKITGAEILAAIAENDILNFEFYYNPETQLEKAEMLREYMPIIFEKVRNG